jgi:hypothetical protein
VGCTGMSGDSEGMWDWCMQIKIYVNPPRLLEMDTGL